MDAIVVADLQSFFPSKKYISELLYKLTDYMTQQNTINNTYLENIELLQQENIELKEQVQKSVFANKQHAFQPASPQGNQRHQAQLVNLPAPASTASPLPINYSERQYFNIKEIKNGNQINSEIYSVNNCSRFLTFTGKVPITLEGINKYYNYIDNNGNQHKLQIIDIFLVYIDNHDKNNIKKLNGDIYNINITHRKDNIYVVHQTENGIPITMQYIQLPSNTKIDDIAVVGYFQNVTNDKDIYSRTGKRIYVTNMQTPATYPPANLANYLPNRKQPAGFPV